MAASRNPSPDLTTPTLVAFGAALILTLPIGFVACALANGWLG